MRSLYKGAATRTQELQLYLDRVSQLLRAGGRLRDVLASGAEEEAYQKAVLASLATDPGTGSRCLTLEQLKSPRSCLCGSTDQLLAALASSELLH